MLRHAQGETGAADYCDESVRQKKACCSAKQQRCLIVRCGHSHYRNHESFYT